MKIPLSWLKEYVKLDDKSAQEIALSLTQAGLEVEEIAEGGIFSIKVPSNRGDCLSVRGVARELSAIFQTPLNEKNFTLKESGDAIEKHVSVEVKTPELCPRYSARLVTDVKICPSPAWMQEKLKTCGLNPINNVVDITNLVCLEFGQPMHAFDFETLEGKKIIVREAQKEERLMMLDESSCAMDEETLVIADEKHAVAMAGVMGGLPTGVTEKTHTILFESANFAPAGIRRTSQKYAKRTESSYRFERGVDAAGTVAALDYACCLLLETGTGNAAKDVVDVCAPALHETRSITLREKQCNSLLGTHFTKKELTAFLTRLHFKTREMPDGLQVSVPSFRQDIKLEVDIIEEIARLYGYNNIQETIPRAPIMSGAKNKEFEFQKVLRNLCLKLGLQQVHTHSFVSPQLVQKCLMDSTTLIPVRNPVSEEACHLRGSLLPSLLDVAARCASHQEENLHIFEIGKTYHKNLSKADSYTEHLKLAVLMMGTPVTNPWNAKEDAADNFYYLKGTLELFLSRLGIKNIEMKQTDSPVLHPYNSAIINRGKGFLGYMGEIHPQVAQNFGITKKVYMFELDDVTRLYSPDALKKSYAPLPRFPSVHRDIAFFIDKNIPQYRVEEILRTSGGKLLEGISLFDVYEEKPVPEGMKNLAYALNFRHAERTLKNEEVDVIMEALKKALKKEGAVLRE